MAPVRLDLTTRLAAIARGARPRRDRRARTSRATSCWRPSTTPATSPPSRGLARPVRRGPRRGLGTEDDPAFPGMHEASARIVQGTVELCARGVDAVRRARRELLRRPAPRDGQPRGGFCIYNDAAVGIQHLLDNGAERVAYVDIDVHHGDGVERIFWNDPRVLTDLGARVAGARSSPARDGRATSAGPTPRGRAVNVALPPGTGRRRVAAGHRRRSCPHLVAAFEPDVLVTQHGCDTHSQDPLAHLAVSVDAQRRAHERLHRPGPRRRRRQVGGPGRRRLRGRRRRAAVMDPPRGDRGPRARAGRHRDPAGVARPRRALTGRDGPATMGDLRAEDLPIWVRSWGMGHNPDRPVDAAILATRQAVFPLHGLDPWFD